MNNLQEFLRSQEWAFIKSHLANYVASNTVGGGGDELNIARSPYNVVLDGVTTGQATAFQSAVTDAIASGQRLYGRGTYLVSSGADAVTISRATADFALLRFLEGSAGVSTSMLSMTGSSIGTKRETDLWAHGINVVPNPGIGEYDWQGTKSLATGFDWSSDGNSNSRRHFVVNRLKRGVLMRDNTEKHGEVFISGSANTILLEVQSSGSGSPDSNNVAISGSLNMQILRTADSSSGTYKITHESRIDDGSYIGEPGSNLYNASDAWLYSRLIPSPGIHVIDGKFTHILFEEVRGHNGRNFLYINKNSSDGCDSVRIEGQTVHMYGVCLWADSVGRLMGHPVFSDIDNGRANYSATTSTYDCPAVRLNRVYDPSGFYPTISKCLNREGYRIGDATSPDRDGNVGALFPTKATFNLSGSMAERLDDGQIMGPNPRIGFYPKNKNFLVVEKAFACEFVMPNLEGNIVLENDCQDCNFELPAGFIDKGYNIDDSSAAYGNNIKIRGRTKFSHIANKAFLDTGLKAVSVEGIEEYVSAPAVFVSDRWNLSAPLSAPTAKFESLSSDLNWRFKREGQTAFDTTTGLLMVATGDGQTDDWEAVDGSSTLTPVANTNLAALLLRMSSAPSALSKWYNIYDRILTDLSSVWSNFTLFYLLGAHDSQAAKLNWPDATYDLTEHNSPTFTAGSGFLGNATDAYLESGYAGAGVTSTDIHVGATALQWGSVNVTGDICGSANNNLRIRSAEVGSTSNRGNAGTSSLSTGFTSQFPAPRHILANSAALNSSTVRENGVLRLTLSTATSGVPDTFDILRGASGYSDELAHLIHAGTALTTDEQALVAAMADQFAYMTGAV